MGVGDPAGPFSHGLGNGVFEGSGTGGDSVDLGSEKAHPVNVQSLSPGVFLAHEDFTFHIHQGCRCGGGYAVLACAGLSDDAGFAHFLGEKDLAQYVVDLVSSGVV